MIDVSAFVKTLKNKPIAVFGMGVSGLATAKALSHAGAHVIASDDNKNLLIDLNIPNMKIFETINDSVLESCAILIPAPGIAPMHPLLQKASALGVEIIGDVEVFGRAKPKARTIGITGTNGKSTTTALMHHVLKHCGLKTEMGGNIGKAVLDMDDLGSDGIYVLELSSYQLDLCINYAPEISVLLNLTPDHLDRYGAMENYAASKAHIFEGPGHAVITTDDFYTKKIAQDVFFKGERDLYEASYRHVNFETDALKGEHNRQNIAAVLQVTKILNLNEPDVRAAIESFSGLAHRQYLVRRMGDISFVNDSKATNAQAAAKALSSYDDIFWILGGQAKEGGLQGLEIYAPKIRHGFLIGQAALEFSSWFEKNKIKYTISDTLDVAVKQAYQESQKHKKATILLAPACASWDQFKSFEDRGNQFVKLIEALT